MLVLKQLMRITGIKSLVERDMQKLIVGLFENSQMAGEAVAELKENNQTDSVSLIAKDEEGDVSTHQIKEDVSEGTTAGAATGGIIGALTGLILGLSSVAVPGLGLLVVGGPLAATWAVTGAAAGALTGGLVGALVDAGIPEENAKMFEEHVREGEVLVAVEVDDEDEADVNRILAGHGVRALTSFEV